MASARVGAQEEAARWEGSTDIKRPKPLPACLPGSTPYLDQASAVAPGAWSPQHPCLGFVQASNAASFSRQDGKTTFTKCHDEYVALFHPRSFVYNTISFVYGFIESGWIDS